MWKLTTVFKLPLEPLEDCGSVYGHNMIFQSPQSASQLHWTGHIIRMNDSRLPKAVFYGELSQGKRLRGGQRLRYKDVVKRHLKATHITVDHWETLAKDRQQWRQAIHKGKSHTEEKIQQKYQHDHNLRHGLTDPSAPVIFCVNCGRGFKSQIGLFSHQ